MLVIINAIDCILEHTKREVNQDWKKKESHGSRSKGGGRAGQREEKGKKKLTAFPLSDRMSRHHPDGLAFFASMWKGIHEPLS
jgi:hypothetical protein